MLTRPDKTKGERDHDWPRFLPGGHAVLFTITSATAERTSAQVAVLDLRSPSAAPKILIRGGSDARYIPTGHLVYLAGDSLRAVPFDIDRLEVKPGSTVPVLPAVASVTFTAGEFDVADDGTLVYVLPGEGGTVERTLAWVDRHGKEEAIPAPTHAYLYPRISPEGTRIAVDLREQDNDVWVWDLVRRGFTRVTKDTSLDRTPLWTANGERLFFSSTRDGNSNIYVTRADGTGTPERLTNVDLAQFPISLSPKGDQVVVQQGAGGVGAGDVMLLRLDGRPSSTAAAPSTPQATAGTLQMLVAQPLVKTSDGEGNGTISPDGRWIAYQSNESGSWEIYVLPFPDVARAARATVSTGGGTQPRWSPNGPELFYVSPRNEMMRVRIGTGATWSAGTPEKLFDAGAYFLGGIANPYFNYDIAKDGRFLMIKSGASEAQADSTASIVVVQNWFEELKRLVSVR